MEAGTAAGRTGRGRQADAKEATSIQTGGGQTDTTKYI